MENALAKLGQTIGMTFAPDTYQAVKGARERQKYQNALAQFGDLTSTGDYAGASKAIMQYDPNLGLEAMQIGEDRRTQAAERESQLRTQDLENLYNSAAEMRQMPAEARLGFAQRMSQQFGVPMPQSAEDLSDAALDEDLAMLRTQLGMGAPEVPEAPGATSTIGKINQDLQNEFITQEQADAAIAKANAPRGPLAQVTVEGDAPPPLPTNKTLTPLQQKMDDGYADLLVKWNIGGAGDTVKQLDQLGVVADRLESGENVTGFLLGNMPDWMLAGLNPQAMDTKELVQEVVQRSLRDTLGAQFTEREGEMLLARAYNPRLDEKLNAARLRRLISTIESRAQQINSLNEYMGRNGTSQGWDGSIMSATQILSEMDQAADGANTPQSGQKRRVFNPATGEFES